jgi:hypothetical protein
VPERRQRPRLRQPDGEADVEALAVQQPHLRRIQRVNCHIQRVNCHIQRVNCHIQRVNCHIQRVNCYISRGRPTWKKA